MDRDAIRRLVENSLAYRRRLRHRETCEAWAAGRPCSSCGLALRDFGVDLLAEYGVRGKH